MDGDRDRGVLSWEEPRVTAGFVMLLLIGSWALIYVEIVTRFFVKFVLGVVVKTVFKIISPAAMKFGVSAGILFAMRHPAILPDEKTKAVQEAKERARKERERAKELACAARRHRGVTAAMSTSPCTCGTTAATGCSTCWRRRR